MLSFAHPWLALLLPLPALAYWLLPAYEIRRPAVRVPFFAELVRLTGAAPRQGASVGRRGLLRMLVLVLCWLLALAALMRPQWVLPPIHQDRPARDLLMLVDLSGSMDTRDFTDPSGKTIDRLTAVKQVLDTFLARRDGDRVGIVVFGNAPFMLVPFTTDLHLARRMLAEMQVGMAGPRTAFGDAIGLGINLFAASTAPAKTMIALTDGNDTASKVTPADAARIARDRGIVIDTIAVGDPTAAGEEKLDEAALQDVATVTGGGYYRALDREELAGIYARIDQLEARKVETVSFQPRRELYWMPLALLTVLSLLVQAFRLVRWPRRRGMEVAP
ncbi:VWA domain-containing protein [Chelatococcus asaccharovorans]|uniref:VWA domain-containing protein n=1 Tax=Chelatococcus asaccharovorans TaxID=28210 RepID=UPI00224C682F|nr:VWA domain-containing protein [Chelatococcus asaccharovorans]CAH1664311.1 BatA (Bacteroides aerotolerance operon) [Chelatococcus asaccharovorans]CAH1682458.1 BatA (Bacteroides aerotolerance operon) [Chelatococcus asaccharovorans]